MLLAGLAIVTWCLGILHTVTNREALHSVSALLRQAARDLVRLGLPHATDVRHHPEPVPYPVIPLAVIGLDMIIATLPLAGLLIWQILESMHVVGQANTLLAKNILWWFGHPVVYLLLFPAVAVYYLADPALRRQTTRRGTRDRGRLDDRSYRKRRRLGTPPLPRLPERDAAGPDQHGHAADHVRARAAVGAVALQPRLHHPHRSRFRWTPAYSALFGLVGWLLAGTPGSSTRQSRSTSLSTTRSGSSATSTTWRC